MSGLLMLQVIAVLLYSSLWFLVAQRMGRFDVADIAWGLGYVFLAFAGQLYSAEYSIRGTLVLAMITLWGLRLSLYIHWRNRGKTEDPRYRNWRRQWGAHASLRAYFQLFLFQGLLIVLILFPATYVLSRPDPALTWLDAVGAVVWLGGFLTETIGDIQLYRFKRNPANRGKFICTGLWKYSRHPNYFGEVILWWGVWLVALSVPGGWMSLPGPVTITVLILFVSGIPLLEKRYEGNAEFEAYQRRTSAFIPLPPKQ